MGNPLALVGSWRVTAAGEPRGTSLILADDLRLFRHCGMLQGSWSADRGGDFVAEVFGGSSRCFNRQQSTVDVPWIRQAVSYRVDGPDRVLLNPAHQVVARLRPGAHPTPGPDIEPTLASPPAVTPSLIARFANPVPLPNGLRPAAASDVIGRWRAVGRDAGPPQAFVEFDPGGQWTGSDGCNGAGGRYAIGFGGELIAISGGSTLIGCHNSPAPTWLGQTGRVAISRDELTLFDRTGKKLGTLKRST